MRLASPSSRPVFVGNFVENFVANFVGERTVDKVSDKGIVSEGGENTAVKGAPAPSHRPGVALLDWGAGGAVARGGATQTSPITNLPGGTAGGASSGGLTQFLMASSVASQVW